MKKEGIEYYTEQGLKEITYMHIYVYIIPVNSGFLMRCYPNPFGKRSTFAPY